MSIQNQDERDILTLARWIRGDIRCQKSSERKCGYLIRPELWFSTMKSGIARALEAKGLPVRMSYSNTEEIASILHIIDGLEEWSNTYDGIMMVKDLNGILDQPSTYEEVLYALDLLEKSRGINSDTTLPSFPQEE